MADANSIIAKAQAYADSLQQRAEAFVATLQNVAQPTDPLVIASVPGLSIQAAPFIDSISAILAQLNGQTLTAPAIITPSAQAPMAPTNAELGLTSIATTDLTNLQVPDFTAVAPALYLPATPSLNLPSAPGNPPTFTAPTCWISQSMASTAFKNAGREFYANMPTKVTELLALIQADGWRLVRQKGSHRQYHHASKPGTVTVAGKGSVEVPPGTLNSILKQAGLKK